MEKKTNKDDNLFEVKAPVVEIMAPAVDEFGSGTSPFTCMSSSDWAMSDTDSPFTYQSHITVDNDGEYCTSSLHTFGGRTDIVANYEAKTVSAIDVSLSAGEAGDIAYDSISISTNSGAKATASIKAHQHDSGTHLARARTVTIPSFNGWGASLFGMDIGVDAECIQSGSYEVALGHVDQPNNEGDNLVGITCKETHTATFNYVSDTAPTTVTGWTITNKPDGFSKNREGFCTGTVTYVKHVAV
jgi:hypothetical protein